MADTKISDMTAATQVNNADLVPIVQSAVNKKTSRALFLTGAPAEDLVLLAGAGAGVSIVDDVGNVVIKVDGFGNVTVQAIAGFISLQYVPAGGAVWGVGAPPQTCGDAIDRLSAWMALNFPLVPPP